MTQSSVPLNQQRPHWQDSKHLKSGERVWILTDIEASESRYLTCSEPQTLHKVGVYDLRTEHVGWATFGRDVAYAMMKARLPPPPWKAPMSVGVEVHREAHGDGEEKGRYLVEVECVAIPPELHAVVPVAKRKFADAGYWPNSTPGMWDGFVARAVQENAIEAAALAMVGPFSAGDVRRAIEDPHVVVTPVLQRLVRQGKLLPPTGTKRWTKYEVAPPAVPVRIDWQGA